MAEFQYGEELKMLMYELKIADTDPQNAWVVNELKIALVEKLGDCDRVKMKLKSLFLRNSSDTYF
ncbi:hypothetical protein D0469_01325 [Peribacillus saganii]|uniref:Uncharacterized protein n=1 Tax=Peribacillus saganii TaxID=2303992 RepID=A0A372LTJ9_9BACI|nr:hypothetical protein [Peribacillus saganii]RFU71508.1 hypothetical protein D0469_01325 [Peribacillus saganii]